MRLLPRIGALFAPLLLLSACLLTPGRFTSTLDIRADRSFTFTYQGEVIVSDIGNDLKGLGKDDDETDDIPAKDQQTALIHNVATNKQPIPRREMDSPEEQAKMQAIADALLKEDGYRSVRYLGNHRFDIDYQLSGKLDHGFLFPFNVDAQAIFPFVAIEVRKNGKVRVQAPGFASDNDKSGGAIGGDDSTKDRQGTFTLTTNAAIISQNQEDGAKDIPHGKQIIWAITPLTRTVPMAVLDLTNHK